MSLINSFMARIGAPTMLIGSLAGCSATPQPSTPAKLETEQKDFAEQVQENLATAEAHCDNMAPKHAQIFCHQNFRIMGDASQEAVSEGWHKLENVRDMMDGLYNATQQFAAQNTLGPKESQILFDPQLGGQIVALAFYSYHTKKAADAYETAGRLMASIRLELDSKSDVRVVDPRHVADYHEDRIEALNTMRRQEMLAEAAKSKKWSFPIDWSEFRDAKEGSPPAASKLAEY